MSIPIRNQLLRVMDAQAVAALAPELVGLEMRQRIVSASETGIVYFIEDGVASVIAEFQGKLAVELGIVGREGMIGLSVVYGDHENPFQTVMQVAGSALKVDADRLRSLMAERPEVRALMLRFARAFSIQVASTALANGRSKLDERLARWLLMVGDRVGPSFSITHEFISIMLGVRRSGVTLAIQILEGKGFIRATRGAITILDRSGLVGAANSAYGFAEVHYERLLGSLATPLRSPDLVP
ncbi:MAG: Crp/Fnr family transcriptional regulator [Microvirga sp.]